MELKVQVSWILRKQCRDAIKPDSILIVLVIDQHNDYKLNFVITLVIFGDKQQILERLRHLVRRRVLSPLLLGADWGAALQGPGSKGEKGGMARGG